jgi:hypothetical protein
MITKFKKDIAGIEFEFNPMNILRLQLFQVYVMHEDKRQRFHMQINEAGEFKITDPFNCPEEYRTYEGALSEAILASETEVV